MSPVGKAARAVGHAAPRPRVLPQTVYPPRKVPQAFSEHALELMRRGPVRLTDQFGLVSQVDAHRGGLPELLVLGQTNVGKSSLLTALLTPPGSQLATPGRPRQLPNVSRRRGSTQTISFYTIGNQLRLVDSPGYGTASATTQGAVVLEYLRAHAENLARAYVLVSALKGLQDADRAMLALLASEAVPFHVVLTRADLLRSTAAVNVRASDVAAEVGDACRDLRAVPDDMYVTGARANAKLWPQAEPLGVATLRAAMYGATGLAEAADVAANVQSSRHRPVPS